MANGQGCGERAQVTSQGAKKPILRIKVFPHPAIESAFFPLVLSRACGGDHGGGAAAENPFSSRPVFSLKNVSNIELGFLRHPEQQRDRAPSSGRSVRCLTPTEKLQWNVGYLRGSAPARRRRRAIPPLRSG
jgi:hypothetical protein